MVDDATLLAWIDGELPADEAARVAAEVAANPELQAVAEAHRALSKRLKGSFDAVLAEPVPDRLLAAINPPSASVTDLAAVRAARATAPPRRWLPQFAAMAASLAIGLLVGRAALAPKPAYLVPASDGLRAAGVLEVALNDQLAGQAGPVRVAISFRDRAGRLCRSWQVERQEGIACRAGAGWTVTAALARAPQPDGAYRMAGGAPLLAVMDAMIVGEPLDAAAEQAARQRGWR